VSAIVGIDLGTTHSLIGFPDAEGPRLIANASGGFLTPSVVSVDASGEVHVGAAARERLLTDPDSSVATFKRWMGSNRLTKLGKRTFRPEELSSLVLKSLLRDAQAVLAEPITEAVISVPAYFSDAQRKATRIAGELAGIKVERLVNEPTAAALAYGLNRDDEEQRLLVFDLGGGTFDVSVLESFSGVMEVRATAGDNYLGGEEFSELLCATFLKESKHCADTLTRAELAELKFKIERLKCRLSHEKEAGLEIALAGKTQQWQISEARFAELCEPLLKRMRAPLERAVRDARLDSALTLDQVILVGGASRMPMISRLIARTIGKLPLRHLNPDEVVGLGATILAGMKARKMAYQETVLTDVCPYTLGVEIGQGTGANFIQGVMSPIIERNTIVPASRVERYHPLEEGQRILQLKVFQGEARMVAQNVFLGALEVPLKGGPNADSTVDVRFTYDTNGILEVEATRVDDGHSARLLIEKNPGVLSADEIKASLAKLAPLKLHPREESANRSAVVRAERLYEELIGDERRAVGEWLDAFNVALGSQDRLRIEGVRKRLSEFLDQIERGPLL